MQKPALIRAIYSEIRRGLPQLPAGEALEMAHRLLRAYTEDPDQTKIFGREGEVRSLARLPVDEAMQDGGWRVMEYELRRAGDVEDLDAGMLAALRPIIEKYLGPEWQHPSLARPL
jgi:hypothetical protein